MRVALFILIVLVSLGSGLASWPDSSMRHTGSGHKVSWVRTSEGWQRATWLSSNAAYAPPLHPLTLAFFVGLVSLTALLSFPAVGRPINRHLAA